MCETRTLSVFECMCCALGAQSQLSLTAVSWETSDEMLNHLLSLCMYVCESMYGQLGKITSLCFFFFSLERVSKEELST